MIAALLTVALATSPASGPWPSSSPDQALEQPLSLESRGLSIDSTLALIGRPRELSLSADPSVGSLTLDISVEGVTVRQTLERLASSLGLRLTRVGPGVWRLARP